MKSLLENTDRIGNSLTGPRGPRSFKETTSARRSARSRSAPASSAAVLAALMLMIPACSSADASDGTLDPLQSSAPSGGEEGQESPVQSAAGEGAQSVESGARAITSELTVPEEQPAPTFEARPPAATAPGAATPPGAATEPTESGEVTTPTEPAAPATPRATMTTSGRQILDSCGNPFVTRGVEQIFGEQLPEGNDWVGLVEEIAASGVNAVRVLAGTNTLGTDDVDALLAVVADRGMVAYVTPYGNEAMQWLDGEDVRAMLAKHEKYIIIDAFGEPTFDDRERFVRDSTDALRQVRSWGYRVPLTVTANQYGRDLPSILELGEQIISADPLGNTILGWQAYWSNNGFYQEHYGMSLTEAVQAVANAPFPIQLGLDRVTDFPSDATADFGTLLSATEANDIGWLWWDWYNPYGDENNLTQDGSSSRLTPTGETVVSSHAASVRNTSRLACRSE